jgi:hypothetical protein
VYGELNEPLRLQDPVIAASREERDAMRRQAAAERWRLENEAGITMSPTMLPEPPAVVAKAASASELPLLTLEEMPDAVPAVMPSTASPQDATAPAARPKRKRRQPWEHAMDHDMEFGA